jgi:hypothetical protein
MVGTPAQRRAAANARSYIGSGSGGRVYKSRRKRPDRYDDYEVGTGFYPNKKPASWWKSRQNQYLTEAVRAKQRARGRRSAFYGRY